MKKSSIIRQLLVVVWVCIYAGIVPSVASAEKLGVLFIDAGEKSEYGARWLDGYFDHLFPFMPPGFFAGRTGWEGNSCYSHIHFADEAESAICNVPEGTPIDIFCTPHPEYEGYDSETGLPIVRGIFRESFLFGDDTFGWDCYDDGISDDPTVLFTLLGSETDNPYNTHPWGFDHLGAHVNDPDGPGIGIADFIETGAFDNMHKYYYTFNSLGNESPYDGQVMEWYYGALGSTNIKDALLSAVLADPELAGTEVVFRHGSEAFMHNKDIYGQPHNYPDSVETAFDELINDEAVDRIIVFALGSGYTNIINHGPTWRDKDGNGVSSVPGQTYKECIEDITDDVGPETEAGRDQLIDDKPWHMYKTIMKEALHLNDDRVPLSFTLDYGTSSHYDQTILSMLEYTVNKYNIPNDGTSLKIVLTTHGYAGGHLDGAECDVYYPSSEETTSRVISTIENNFSWNGKLEIVPGPVEYSQPSGEGGNVDPPSPGNPFGNMISAGEQVDMAIKGTYINELGETVDNGLVDDATNDIFDYVLLIPQTFDAESGDTLGCMRADVLGNHEAGTVEGSVPAWLRQELDQNGLEYGDPNSAASHYPFHDSENFTVRVMDGSGWCSEDINENTVCKGAGIPDATRVVLSGAMLSYPDGSARQHVTSAAVEAIMGAIKDPDIGGYDDPEIDLPPEITAGPVRTSDSMPLSADPLSPTAIESRGQSIVWTFADDKGSCSDPATHIWQYRTDDTEEWNTQSAGTFWSWVWTDDIGLVTGSGPFEFRVAATDCADNTTYSDIHYILVDLAPEISAGPVRTSDSVLLSADPGAPTLIEPDGQSIVWTVADDHSSCSGPDTTTWQYRVDDTEDWTTISADRYLIWVWTDDIGSITGSGTFEFSVSITDCMGQTTTSPVHYITIDLPPEIPVTPTRLPDETPLSVDPNTPTLIDGMGQPVFWTFSDDSASCGGACSHEWEYRTPGSEVWQTEIAPSYMRWVWIEDPVTIIGEGMFEFRVWVTDCAGNTTASEVYYIEIG